MLCISSIYELNAVISSSCVNRICNGYRVPLFRQQLHVLSQLLGRTFRVCHLPPYCSKYNPIDHRLFCHLSRFLQAMQLTCKTHRRQITQSSVGL
jgi:hypothetical protein